MSSTSIVLAVRIPIPHELVIPALILLGVVLLLLLVFFLADKLAAGGSKGRLLAIFFLLVSGPLLMAFPLLDGFRSLFYAKCRDESAYAGLKAQMPKQPEPPKPPAGTRPGDKVTVHVTPTKFKESIDGQYRVEEVRADLTVDGDKAPARRFEQLPATARKGWELSDQLIRGRDGGRGWLKDGLVVVAVTVVTPAEEALFGKKGTFEISGRVVMPIWAKDEKSGYVAESDVMQEKESIQFISREALQAHEREQSAYKASLQAVETQRGELHAQEKLLDDDTANRFEILEWTSRLAGILCLLAVGILFWRGRHALKKEPSTKLVT